MQPFQITVSVPAIFKGGSIADECEKVSRSLPLSIPVVNHSEMMFNSIKTKTNGITFAIFDIFHFFDNYIKIPDRVVRIGLLTVKEGSGKVGDFYIFIEKVQKIEK